MSTRVKALPIPHFRIVKTKMKMTKIMYNNSNKPQIGKRESAKDLPDFVSCPYVGITYGTSNNDEDSE